MTAQIPERESFALVNDKWLIYVNCWVWWEFKKIRGNSIELTYWKEDDSIGKISQRNIPKEKEIRFCQGYQSDWIQTVNHRFLSFPVDPNTPKISNITFRSDL